MITVRILILHENSFGRTLQLNLTKVKISELILKVSRELNFDLKKYLYNKLGELREGRVILVNGVNIHFLKGLETEIASGDRVIITVVASGG